MERRLFLAIALSVAVMFLYKFVLEARYPGLRPQRQPALIQREVLQHPEIKEVSTINLHEMREKIDVIKIKNYEYAVSNLGGCIKKLSILRAEKDKKETLIDSQDPQGLLYTKIFLDEQNKIFDDNCQLIDNTPDSLTYSFPSVGDVEVIKQINFHNTNNTIELNILIKNKSEQTRRVGYELITGTGMDGSDDIDKRFVLTQIKLPNKIQTVTPRDRQLRSGPIKFEGDILWTAIKNRYYAVIMKPQPGTSNLSSTSSFNDKYLRTSIIVSPKDIPPQAAIQDKFIVYVGPQDYEAVRSLNLTIEDAISYGMLGSISIFLLKILRLFSNLVGNYGVAIILLTATLSILLYPLTLKSLGSMKKMQQLQPQIDKLRQDNKDNPQRLNKEIMELYRKNKINPLGGCLPMVLQIPIFIALYKALMGSADLKYAKFLWIKDLSRPDAAFKLPFYLPILGNFVNILPILMLIAMFVQQKISQPAVSSRQEQKMLSILMPIVFGFLFYSLPSGLVLYWLTNTIITTSVQWFFIRR